MEDFPIGSKDWKEFVIAGAKTMGINISWDQAEQIAIHCNELLLWNEKVNLTAITKPVGVAVKHVLDSIPPINIITPDAAVLDIGSGGGFPGIALKIVEPRIRMTLIDASRKKTTFLKHVIRYLNLKNIEALHSRTDNLATDLKYANSFEVVISRSFASLDKLALAAAPFLSDKSMIIALKGKNVKQEVDTFYKTLEKEQKKSRFSIKDFSIEIIPYVLPYAEIERFMVVLKKSIRR